MAAALDPAGGLHPRTRGADDEEVELEVDKSSS